jgi:double zinc ribbon protein
MLELILGILLAAGAIYFVLLPILRPPVESASDVEPGDEGEDPADDMSPQTVALRALKEIEFDRATGKLSDSDYEQLKGKYTAEALAALRGDVGRGTGDVVTSRAPTRPPSLVPRPACPTHGQRPEKDAVFCSECGKRLGSAPGYCARCGTALEGDARYCNRCGARVAA